MDLNLRGLCIACCLAGLIMAAGCSKFDLNKNIPWKVDDEPVAPVKVTATWTDTVLQSARAMPQRGFGGRLMFHDNEKDGAVKVDGKLIVYAFDEEGRAPTDLKPTRKYVFEAEQFARHYSKSRLGHSYSVWLPWDQVGGEQEKISLIVRFIPTEGPVVIGDQTTHILPGTTKELQLSKSDEVKESAEAGDDAKVRPVSYESPTSGLPKADADSFESLKTKMNTTTISIPPRFGSRTTVTDVQTSAIGPSTTNSSTESPSMPGRELTRRLPPVDNEDSTVPTDHSAGNVHVLQAAITETLAQGPERERESTVQRSTRYSPSRSRLLREPIVRPERDRGSSQQRPEAWRSHFRSTLPSVTGSEFERP